MGQNLSFTVRPATIEDAEAIGTIQTRSWQTTYFGIVHQSFLDSMDIQKRILSAINRVKNPQNDCLVLVENSSHKVVGFADIGPCREKTVDADGELYAIYLFKDYQGFGGGKLLFEKSLSVAQGRNFSRMMVSVLEKNVSSRKFYEKMGGQYIGSDHVDIENHRYPTSTYLWKI